MPEHAALTSVKELIPIIAGTAIAIAFFVVYGALAAWLVNDAHRRGYSGILPYYLLYCCGPVGSLLWLVVRPRTRLADRPLDAYSNADDALTAAAKLDMLGDWDEAINLYGYAAAQWPEHKSYANECVKVIVGKKEVR
jgi:hypothetical protein